MGGGSGRKVEIEVRGYDLETGEALAKRVQQGLEEIEGITDVRLSREMGEPEGLISSTARAPPTSNSPCSGSAESLGTVLLGTPAGTSAKRAGNPDPRQSGSAKPDVEPLLDLTLTN